MHPRVRIVLIAALLVGGLLLVRIATRPGRVGPAAASGAARSNAAPKVMAHGLEPPTGEADTNRMVRLSPGQILATVNGRQITLGDLIPLRGTNTQASQVFSRQTYDYLLQRAIGRELVLQTAKAQGLELTGADQRQLANARALRALPEPGQVQRLSLDQAQLDFEMRDAQAFLLQSALLAGTGVSPNVTPEDVSSYYQAHAAEFGDLPAEEQARKAAWAQIDAQIRQKLAAPIRSLFQNRLLAYMQQLQSGADITVNPLADP
jgi:hypothetical protein